MNLKKFKLVNIFSTFDAKKKLMFLLIIVSSVFSGIFELSTVGLLVPILSSLLLGTENFLIPDMFVFNSFANILDNSSLITKIIIIFGIVATSVLVRIFTLFVSSKFAFEAGKFVGTKILFNILSQKYLFFSNELSADAVNLLTVKLNLFVTGVLLPVVGIISSIIIVFILSYFLVLLDPFIFLTAMFVLLSCYLVTYLIVQHTLVNNSTIVSSEISNIVSVTQSIFAGIKDIKVNRYSTHFLEQYIRAESRLRAAQSQNFVLASFPKFFVEALVFLVLGVGGLFALSGTTPIGNIVPVAVAFGLVVQRMLPILQGIYANLAIVKGAYHSYSDIERYLSLIPTEEKFKGTVNFLSEPIELELVGVSFCYPDSPTTLNDVNLKIIPGKSYAFVGPSGVGKSTLVDLIVGLLEPSQGELNVKSLNSRIGQFSAWQDQIFYAPQDTFVFPGSLIENITLKSELEQIDVQLLEKCIQATKLYNIERNYLSSDSQIELGENGGRLSGGQRQRLGIARALYSGASILVLDEPTSSLDSKTAKEVIENIIKFDHIFTIIIITHDPMVENLCDVVVSLSHETGVQIREINK